MGKKKDTDDPGLIELAHSNVIRGIEIFAAGTHNKMTFTEADIDAMVKAHAELDFRPAIKIGHTKDKPGAPAYGWVTNLTKKVVDGVAKLYADFESMHDTVIQALRDRRYDRVSSEIYFNLERGGKKFARALKAVALLGAEVPAVAELVPLHKMEFAVDGFEAINLSEAELEVPMLASFASLEARIAGLVNYINEDADMAKKNAGKIAELRAELESFKAKMAAKKGDEDEDSEDMKGMKKKCSELETRIAELEADDAKDDELEAKLATRDAQIAALTARERKRDVKERVDAIALPALRAEFAALYDYALQNNGAQVEVFSTDDKGNTTSAKKSLVDTLDALSGKLDELNKKVFSKLTVKKDEKVEDEDPSAEADKRANALLNDKAKGYKSYSEALEAVFVADPALRDKINATLPGTAS